MTRSSDKFTISELLVDREGTPWVAVTEQVRPKGRWAFRSVLYAHDGDDWERRFERSRTGNLGTELRLGPDGSAWALTATEGPGAYRFFRLDGTRWTRIPRPPAPADSPDHQIRSWGIAADGALWMARKRAISRFDGASWETVGRLPKDAGNTLVFDPEGAVHTLLGSDGERTIRTHRRGDDRERSGVPVAPVPGPGDSWGEIDVLAPDGSLWRSLSTTRSCGFWCAYLTACDGLARFDGAEWHGYLEDRCIHEIDFDVLGNTWVRASEPTAGEQVTLDDGTEVQPLTVDRVDLYLIARDASGSS